MLSLTHPLTVYNGLITVVFLLDGLVTVSF